MMLKTLLATSAVAAALVGAPAHAAPDVLTCTGTVTGGTYSAVRVPAGASCTLIDATVTHGVHARNAADVILLDTDVARNINITGTTGSVVIGPAGCKVDPIVGNNVHVRRSHDVLICQVRAKNNISVTGSDGRITVRDSRAGNNISVSRNLAYTGTFPSGANIRVRDDVAGNHIRLFGNDPSRPIVVKNDTPTPVIK